MPRIVKEGGGVGPDTPVVLQGPPGDDAPLSIEDLFPPPQGFPFPFLVRVVGASSGTLNNGDTVINGPYNGLAGEYFLPVVVLVGAAPVGTAIAFGYKTGDLDTLVLRDSADTALQIRQEISNFSGNTLPFRAIVLGIRSVGLGA